MEETGTAMARGVRSFMEWTPKSELSRSTRRINASGREKSCPGSVKERGWPGGRGGGEKDNGGNRDGHGSRDAFLYLMDAQERAKQEYRQNKF